VRPQDLHHVVAAAAEILGEEEFVVVGSQAILGTYPDAPEELLRSMEADVYPRRAPDKAIDIEGSLGDGSAFQQTYGYYAHGVGPETAKAPTGWEDRLVPVEIEPRVTSTTRVVAFCLEPHDLVLSKLAANRERDWEFAKAALAAGLVQPDVLRERVVDLPVREELRESVARSLSAILGRGT
jgi:hypothetical protein